MLYYNCWEKKHSFPGTISNETAEYRACRCLHNFYRLDRFGPCSACPPYGFFCEKDTAILAPNYFWEWTDQSQKERFKGFVNNIHSFGPDYNKSYSTFNTSLPKPLKCPHAKSCKGGIDSECHQGYKGTLCATCSEGFYFRFNSCLKCPRLPVTITSSILVIALFVAVFLMVLWGDSKRTKNNRTVADSIVVDDLPHDEQIDYSDSTSSRCMCRDLFYRRQERLHLPAESWPLHSVFHSLPQLVLAHGVYLGIISRGISTSGSVSHLQVSRVP